jgi:hypothetical protein
MSLLGSIVSGITGLISSNKNNKLQKEQYADQKRLTDQQIQISNYIQSLSKELMTRGSNQVDPYGGTTGYDPVTGTYKSTLGVVPQAMQDASDQEELMRSVYDQRLRRQGLTDAEAIRSRAAGESNTALDTINNFDRGIGAVDPTALAARMRLDRQGAVNAGYDDAERAATTLQARTGSSAVGDAFTRIARDRVRAHAEVGDPEVEALGLAEQVNQGRRSSLMSNYGNLADRGQRFYDTNFTSSPYAATADAKVADQMKFDLSKYDVAQGGSGTAAAGIGSAAAGLRQAFAAKQANTVQNPWGNFIGGVDKAVGNEFGNIFKSFLG